jgi:hypothetical protein
MDTLVDVKRLTVAKNAVRKQCATLTVTEKWIKKFPCFMVQRINAGARLEGMLIHNSWEK